MTRTRRARCLALVVFAVAATSSAQNVLPSPSPGPDASIRGASSASPGTASSTSPSEGRWEIAITPAVLRLGIDRAAQLVIRAPRPTQHVPEVHASVGTVRDVQRTGPATFSARYEAPASRAPDLALLVVLGDRRDVPALAVLPLAGRYHLTVDVEPLAAVTVQIADGLTRATAPSHGALDLVLHVPPGVGLANVVATDRSGNTTERTETLTLPPLHRMMLVRADPGPDRARERRWFAIATDPTGAPLASLNDAVEVTGAPATVTMRAPGVCEIAVEVNPQVDPTEVHVRLHGEGVELTPDHEDVTVPALVPTRLTLLTPARARAGELLSVRAIVEAEGGARVAAIPEALHVQLDDGAIQASSAGDQYEIAVTAPGSLGRHVLSARWTHGDRPALETHASFDVTPGTPVRLVGRAPPMRIGAPCDVAFTTLDRFGNAASVEHPSVSASGATVRRIQPTATGMIVTLEPTEGSARIEVRGDYDFRDAVTYPVAPSPMRRFSLSLLAALRSNLGAGVFGGLRFSVGGTVQFVPGWHGLGLIDLGAEGTYQDDSNGSSASVAAVPLALRIGVVRQLGPWQFGAVGGAVVRGVYAWSRARDGGTLAQGRFVPGAAASVIVRWFAPVGVFTLDVGAESGWLDSRPARGALGGIQLAIGWGLAW